MWKTRGVERTVLTAVLDREHYGLHFTNCAAMWALCGIRDHGL